MSKEKKARRFGGGSARTGKSPKGARGLPQFTHNPNPGRKLPFPNGRPAQNLLNPAEVIESEPERYGCPVVLPLFREGICQPSEPACPHAYAQVLALNNRGTDSFRIGVAHNWDHLHAGYFRRRVPM